MVAFILLYVKSYRNGVELIKILRASLECLIQPSKVVDVIWKVCKEIYPLETVQIIPIMLLKKKFLPWPIYWIIKLSLLISMIVFM